MTWRYTTKRLLDYAIAGGTLLAASPLMGAIAIAIKLDSKGAVFFTQERLGCRGRTFKLIKFRTMHDAPIRYHADGSTRVDTDDARVTRVGHLLRGALDELPQLINVLRGEMSVVGPRPDLASQRVHYSPDDERKLAVLPGLTSLAIVHGRNDIPWKQRITIDIQYVERWSLMLDLRIIAQTLLMPWGKRLFDFSDVVDGCEVHQRPSA